jgi:hypothetical protein
MGWQSRAALEESREVEGRSLLMGRAPTFPRAGTAHPELGAATGGAHMTPPVAGLGASVIVIAFLLPSVSASVVMDSISG